MAVKHSSWKHGNSKNTSSGHRNWFFYDFGVWCDWFDWYFVTIIVAYCWLALEAHDTPNEWNRCWLCFTSRTDCLILLRLVSHVSPLFGSQVKPTARPFNWLVFAAPDILQIDIATVFPSFPQFQRVTSVLMSCRSGSLSVAPPVALGPKWLPNRSM